MARIVAFYPMSEYSVGIFKQGAFHLVPFDSHVRGPHDRHIPHRHDFFEIVWIRSGGGRLTCDLQQHAFGPGTFIVLSPGQVHSWTFDIHTVGRIASFTAEFLALSPECPALLSKMPFLYSDPGSLLALDAEESRRVENVFAQFEELTRVEAAGRDDVARAYLIVLLSLIRQGFARRTPTPASRPSSAEGDLLVQRFRLALEQHMPGVVEVGVIARQLRVSRSQLNEALRRGTGRSASEIIHERVLLEAKRVLLHSSLTVAEIAYRLKFQDPSYFGRFFRKYSGRTPGAYREAVLRDALVA
jgi:AraC family transcriptional activator of pobA